MVHGPCILYHFSLAWHFFGSFNIAFIYLFIYFRAKVCLIHPCAAAVAATFSLYSLSVCLLSLSVVELIKRTSHVEKCMMQKYAVQEIHCEITINYVYLSLCVRAYVPHTQFLMVRIFFYLSILCLFCILCVLYFHSPMKSVVNIFDLM